MIQNLETTWPATDQEWAALYAEMGRLQARYHKMSDPHPRVRAARDVAPRYGMEAGPFLSALAKWSGNKPINPKRQKCPKDNGNEHSALGPEEEASSDSAKYRALLHGCADLGKPIPSDAVAALMLGINRGTPAAVRSQMKRQGWAFNHTRDGGWVPVAPQIPPVDDTSWLRQEQPTPVEQATSVEQPLVPSYGMARLLIAWLRSEEFIDVLAAGFRKALE